MPINDDPKQAWDASDALLRRGQEILRDGAPRVEAIWENLGFHVATSRLLDTGGAPPTGPAAQSYIALILASLDHIHAQGLLDDALEETS
jgi:hypothetical protein